MRKVSPSLFVLFLGVLIFAVPAAGSSISGSWDSTVTFAPQTDPIDAFSSTLTVDYTSGDITYSSVSDFSLTGFSDQEFTLDFSLGNLDVVSKVNFDPPNKNLDYWLTTSTLSIPDNIGLTHKFLLQKSTDNGFGSGMELGITGDTPGGLSLSLTSLFGMEEDDDMDSGYSLVTSHGDTEDVYGLSSLQYVSTTIGLTGMELGCVGFDGEAFFSEAEGFEYLDFDFTISNEPWPLEFSSTVKFSPRTKSVTLDPSLTLDFACFTVYNELTGTVSSGTSTSALTGLEVQGFSITGVELGHVEFSSYTALGDNVLADLNGVFDYEDDYDEVLSITKSGDLSLTLDAYFDMTESEELFDFGLLDGSAAYDLSDQFSVGAGAEIGPSSGLEEFALSFDYTF
ncbi:hypothetical protein KGY77_10190 [Candidatus Bipolaricaulota bacterium]|nr:hypothetical protein [Candidatus Bipolaricaulota bacterium]